MGRGRFPGTHKQALTIKGKTDKLDFIKIKNFCSSRDTLKRTNDSHVVRGKFINHLLINNLYPEYMRNS